MRIAILSCFYPYRGGISQFNTYLLKELSKNHTVQAFNFKRMYPDFLFPGKTQFIAKDDDAVPVESRTLLDTANPFSYISTAREIAEWKPDILITRYWLSYFAPSLGTVAQRVAKILKREAGKRGEISRFKSIAIMDNVIPHEPHFFDKPFTKYFINRNNGFITLSHAVEQDLLDIDSRCKVRTIPHPLYSNFGAKLDPIEARRAVINGLGGKNLSDKELAERKVLLFFGLIREYKGLDILLEAMAQLDNTYTLVVAGEPYGKFDRYQDIIDSERLAPFKENIILNTGYIPDGEVKKYFSAADVCVLPYRTATQSGISSISWNFDVPLITTPVGGLVESVGKAGTGMLTEEVTPTAVAKAVKAFFAGGREKYVENIHELKKKLSWESFCSELEKFIIEL